MQRIEATVVILRLSLIIEMFDKYWPSGNRSIDVLFTKSAANVIGAGLGSGQSGRYVLLN